MAYFAAEIFLCFISNISPECKDVEVEMGEFMNGRYRTQGTVRLGNLCESVYPTLAATPILVIYGQYRFS